MEERVYLKPVYLVGKIKNIYVIIEILSYSIYEFTAVCTYLYYCSKAMRNLV